MGLAVYHHFYKNHSSYFGLPDAAGIDITGELTFGCWVYFSPGSSLVDMGIMSKWYTTGNQRAYVINKDTNNKFQLRICPDGSSIAQVNDAAENFAIETWFYVVGRFTPSTELALFVNGTWYLNTAAIPASIYNSSEPLEIGRYNRTNYLDGRACHAFICAYAVPDRFIEAMYAHTRGMFKPQTLGVFV